jgi:hypothetical protein
MERVWFVGEDQPVVVNRLLIGRRGFFPTACVKL